MKGRIQLPMYTAAALAAANPVLLKGEVVYESDTRKRKIGDGITAWNGLPYENGEAASGGGLPVDAVLITTNLGLTKLPFTRVGQIIPIELSVDTPENVGGPWIGFVQCDGVGDNGYWQGTAYVAANGFSSYWKTYVEYGYPVSADAWVGCEFGGNVLQHDGPVPGYKNILSAPSQLDHYILNPLSGTKELEISFAQAMDASEFDNNYIFLDAEIYANGAYTLLTLPLSIVKVSNTDDPITLCDACLWSVREANAACAGMSISMLNFKYSGSKVVGCTLQVISESISDPLTYELHLRGIYLRIG